MENSSNVKNNNQNDSNKVLQQSLDDESKKKEKIKIDTETLWNEVGYHRITGGVFYSYILLIVGAVIGLGTVAIIAEFLPYPEINGYKTLTSSILGFWFGLLDLNLGGGGSLSDGMARFIGQYADTNPKRSMKYIQFYIWFQMWTGVLQVTIIYITVFYYFENTNLAYLSYFILAQTLVQYPGMLMIMEDSLKAFQRGDKTAWLSWMQDTVFQVSINIICLIIGKYWGASNPRIGELMGITIFYILSQFLDDWFNLLIGAKMFSKVMKQRGIEHGFFRLFIPDFDKEVVLEALKFTGKQWIGNQIKGFIGYLIGLYILVITPQMASWQGLLLIPQFLGHLVAMVNLGSPAVPAISESYNNGKEELARYFIHDTFKYYVFITLWMAVPLMVMTPRILETIMNLEFVKGLENYQAGLIMIPWFMLNSGTGWLRALWSKIFVACDKPMPPIYIDYLFTIPGYGFQFLFLYLTVETNILPVWFILFMPAFLNDSLKMIVGYIWLQKTTIKINWRQMAWQVAIAPILASVAYAIVLYIFQFTIWPLLDMIATAAFGEIGPLIIAFIILLCILFVFPAIFFGPFYSLFGGWDDFTIEEFRKCAIISGPSKFITMMLYKICYKFHKLSPWGNKYPIANYELVKKQVEELVEEGKANRLLKH
ncbi:MAG: hypothetical protein ACTSRZ_02875 [Promethearchaeota archaeon]